MITAVNSAETNKQFIDLSIHPFVSSIPVIVSFLIDAVAQATMIISNIILNREHIKM